MRCNPRNIINHSDQKEWIRHRDGDTSDIIETIMSMDADSAKWVDAAAVQCLRGRNVYETLQNVWQFVKRNNRYQADRPGHERVKSPGALFASGTGDCKSYSIAEGAILRALGIRYKYRFAAYERGDFTHVYIMAYTPEGWIPLDAVHTAPFEEVPYYRKKDQGPAGSAVNGIGKAPGTNNRTNNWAPLAFWLAVAYIVTQ